MSARPRIAVAGPRLLNADGVLDVTERHTMVFTGDWNGGERVFDVRPRQKLEFLGLERMDAQAALPQPYQPEPEPNLQIRAPL